MLVAQHASWRWLFVGAAVLGAVQLLVVRRLVDESTLRSGGRFDLLGGLGLAAALVCLLLAISRGSEWGWASGRVIGLLVAAVVLFVGWGRYELRVPAPLVDLRVTARPAVLWTNVSSVLIGFAMFAGFLVTTQILQAEPETGYGFGLSLVAAGLVLLPIGGAMTVFSPLSARLSRRFSARVTLLLGTAVLAAGNLLLATLPGSIPLIMVASTVTAVGAALSYSAIPLIIMDAVPATETAAANSLNTLMRMLGTSSCSAVFAAVASGLVIQVGGRAVPAGARVHRRLPGRVRRRPDRRGDHRGEPGAARSARRGTAEQAGAGGVRAEPAGPVDQPGLGQRGAPAQVHQPALAAQHAGGRARGRARTSPRGPSSCSAPRPAARSARRSRRPSRAGWRRRRRAPSRWGCSGVRPAPPRTPPARARPRPG